MSLLKWIQVELDIFYFNSCTMHSFFMAIENSNMKTTVECIAGVRNWREWDLNNKEVDLWKTFFFFSIISSELYSTKTKGIYSILRIKLNSYPSDSDHVNKT